MTPEIRNKISIVHKGKKMSEEQKKQLEQQNEFPCPHSSFWR